MANESSRYQRALRDPKLRLALEGLCKIRHDLAVDPVSAMRLALLGPDERGNAHGDFAHENLRPNIEMYRVGGGENVAGWF